MTDSINILLSRLEGVRCAGTGKWVARCPAHDDSNPSLSITHADSGKILLHCFAGCTYRDILTAVGVERVTSIAPIVCKPKPDIANKASAIWAHASQATSHEYLTRKHIQAHIAKIYRDSLVVPVRIGDELTSLQFISASGEKKFLRGGKVKGGHAMIGKPNGTLCIAEGFATAVTIHETTGHAVAVAFNCGNLLAVTKSMHETYPRSRLILCADDDIWTDGNPGKTAATDAALSVGALLAIPKFGRKREEGATDFNDLALARGRDMVRRCIAEAK